MKNHSRIKITNVQTFLLNFIIGIGVVHTSIFSMNVLHQLEIVNSTHLIITLTGISWIVIIYLKKAISKHYRNQGDAWFNLTK